MKGRNVSKEDFYGYLKKRVIGSIVIPEKTEWLKKELETGNFLPKQTTGENSVIPYQVHLYELNAIISNLEDKIPLMKKEREKIRKIFTFRIPYYVGPLNGIFINGKTTIGWKEKKERFIHGILMIWWMRRPVRKDLSVV